MKRFSKVFSIALAIFMILAATAYGGGSKDPAFIKKAGNQTGPYGIKYAAEQTLHTVYSTEASNWSTFAGDSSAANWDFVKQTYEGLMTVDLYGNIAPGLAESYTVSPDGLVYTFKLRQGLQYVNNKKQPVAEMTADDFVAVAEYVLNPDNAVISYVWEGVIKGASALLKGETKDYSTLGYKALDKYTLQVTLESPKYYWIDSGGSYVGFPRSFIQQWGSSNGADETKILSIGPYVLTEFSPQSRHVFEKNPYYYDKDKVYIEKIIQTYNAEANTLEPEMFLRGETDSAALGAGIIQQWREGEMGKYVLAYPPGYDYPCYYSFCYDPKFDANSYDVENYKKAIDNEAFRQSLYWALNRQRAAKAYDPYPTSDLNLAYTIVGGEWMYDANGKLFNNYPAFDALKARPNWSFDEQKAIAYKDQAIRELTAAGVKFPVKLYTRYNPGTAGWSSEVEIIVQQIYTLFGSDYVRFIVEAGPSAGFLNAVRRAGDWGFLKLNHGIDMAIRDPAYVSTAAFNGSENNRWTFLQNCKTPNVRALHDQYLALLDRANNITPIAGSSTFARDLENRFTYFAQAEAFLLEHALVIPFHYWYDGYYVSHTFRYDQIGSSYKGARVFAEPLTLEQYNSLYKDYLAAQAKSRAK